MIDKKLFIENTKAMLGNDNCGLVSDGDHSFNDLYHHRAVLTGSMLSRTKPNFITVLFQPLTVAFLKKRTS